MTKRASDKAGTGTVFCGWKFKPEELAAIKEAAPLSGAETVSLFVRATLRKEVARLKAKQGAKPR